MKNASIFWCTGFSGAGKTTLSLRAEEELAASGFSVKVLDGDTVRAAYNETGSHKEKRLVQRTGLCGFQAHVIL